MGFLTLQVVYYFDTALIPVWLESPIRYSRGFG